MTSMTRTQGERTFLHVLINTALANLTTSFLWFALTFWVYLETRSVLATGIIGGAYMLFVAFGSMLFGTIVDHHRKLRVMLLSGTVTLVAFSVAGVLYLLLPEPMLLDLGAPWFWLFGAIVLGGAVVEQMRNIALSTTVTMLVPDERHANANGLVGTVQGLAFIVTSVLSGLAIGQLGMGWTIAIAVALTSVSLAHLLTLRMPQDVVELDADDTARGVDLRGSLRAVLAIGGLFALILFSTFNNLIGGLYMALMDPYGLELFSVEMWGVVFGAASTGFIVGGLAIARFGLGKRPIRTLLIVVMAMGALGALFTIREWWWLYAGGIWLYMCLIRPPRPPSRRSSSASCRSRAKVACSASRWRSRRRPRSPHSSSHRSPSSGSSRGRVRARARRRSSRCSAPASRAASRSCSSSAASS